MMLPFDQYVAFDQCVVAALLLVVVVGGMRLFYGAWPWEAGKTWYHTRPAVDYVEALRGQNRESVLRPVPNVDATTSDNFDRSLIINNDNLSPEVASPPEAPSAAEQPREPKSEEKPPRARRRWLKSNRRKQLTHPAKAATPIPETASVTSDAKIPTITTVEASFVSMPSANVSVPPELDIRP
jgi:hypothetical protein